MKLRLSILFLAAAALAAAPAAGQTVKSLGYNTTNGQIVYSGSNSLTFTNALQFSTNARATTRTNLGLGGSDSVTFSNLSLSANGSLAIGGMNLTAITSGIDLAFKRAGSTELELKTNGLILHVGSYDFSGGNTNGASTTRTNLGLGATNAPTFSNINISIFGSGSSTGFAGRNSGGLFEIYGTNVSSSVPAFYGWSGSANTAFSAGTARTNLELGATNNVTFSNITADGIIHAKDSTSSPATNSSLARGIQWTNLAGFHAAIYASYPGVPQITLAAGASNAFSDVATFRSTGMTVSSNAIVGGTLAVTGNVTMSGVGNTAPSQTADSASSLMTRDLVGQEFANPRTKMQTTYWFGLEGLGLWQTVSGAATLSANRTPRFGPSLAFYATTKPATTAAGAGIRLGGTTITGAGAWRPIDGGAFTASSRVVNYYSLSGIGNRAFGFSFAGGGNTNFWGAPDSFGLFWVQQPTNSWVASTAFALNERIAVSNVVWAVATAGTTATNEPTWTDLINSVVTNGTAVFRNIGPHTSNNWVLAIGHTNASQVVMTNTGKSNWLRASGGNGHEVLLTLRYGTNTAGPYTVYGSVADGTGQGSEVTLNLATNTTQVSPQYWLRYDGTNTATGNEAAGIRYFSMDAETPPLD